MIKYTVIFCWENVRIFCNAKDSHIFPTKNNCICNIYILVFNNTLTNNIVSFELLYMTENSGFLGTRLTIVIDTKVHRQILIFARSQKLSRPGTLQISYEPLHEKNLLTLYASNKITDQHEHLPRLISAFVVHYLDSIVLYELRHEKTGFLDMQKQSSRSASR